MLFAFFYEWVFNFVATWLPLIFLIKINIIIRRLKILLQSSSGMSPKHIYSFYLEEKVNFLSIRNVHSIKRASWLNCFSLTVSTAYDRFEHRNEFKIRKKFCWSVCISRAGEGGKAEEGDTSIIVPGTSSIFVFRTRNASQKVHLLGSWVILWLEITKWLYNLPLEELRMPYMFYFHSVNSRFSVRWIGRCFAKASAPAEGEQNARVG